MAERTPEGAEPAGINSAPGGRSRRQGRKNLTVPRELLEVVDDQLPNVNYSRVLQEGLARLIRCSHERIICARCARDANLAAAVEIALSAFYRDVMADLELLIDRGGTLEGAARLIKRTGERHGITAARAPAPKPTRQQRERDRVREFPLPEPPAPAVLVTGELLRRASEQ